MSFTVDGVLFTPDYKSKERTLYKIIAAKDAEIKNLNGEIDGHRGKWIVQDGIIAELREELRALKAKERRRATKRKKVAAE